MANYIIVSENSTDLPENYFTENNVALINLSFSIDDKEYASLDEFSIKDFYDMMRKGHLTKTSQVTLEVFELEFTRLLLKGFDILYLGFSSGLSGTYNCGRLTAEKLRERFPERKIYTIDSLCASLGQGLLLMHAVEKKKEGMGIDELARWLESNKLNLVHIFTVDDLAYLHRGGRVSKAAAIAGSILGIKPVLHVDNEGKLIPVEKVRGRKQALNKTVDLVIERTGNYKNTFYAISHGDCIEDARYVESEVKKRMGVKNCMMNDIGPVIGSHAGPGTIALFMLGEKR